MTKTQQQQKSAINCGNMLIFLLHLGFSSGARPGPWSQTRPPEPLKDWSLCPLELELPTSSNCNASELYWSCYMPHWSLFQDPRHKYLGGARIRPLIFFYAWS